MSAIVTTLANAMNWLGQWLVGLLTTLWGVILLVLDAALAVVVSLVGTVGTVIVGVFGVLLGLLLNLLPDAVTADHSDVSGIQALSAANMYVPIAEVLTLLPVFGAVAGGIGIYKLAKFIRGGG